MLTLAMLKSCCWLLKWSDIVWFSFLLSFYGCGFLNSRGRWSSLHIFYAVVAFYVVYAVGVFTVELLCTYKYEQPQHGKPTTTITWGVLWLLLIIHEFYKNRHFGTPAVHGATKILANINATIWNNSSWLKLYWSCITWIWKYNFSSRLLTK